MLSDKGTELPDTITDGQIIGTHKFRKVKSWRFGERVSWNPGELSVQTSLQPG